MEVVTYSDKHFLEVAHLIENFHKEAVSEYDNILTPEALTHTIQTADHSNAYLMLIDGICQGILYGGIVRSPMNGSMIFQEIMWYVNKDHRTRGGILLKEVQKKLKEKGVSSMIMVALENSMSKRLRVFYERAGFKAMETHYMREL